MPKTLLEQAMDCKDSAALLIWYSDLLPDEQREFLLQLDKAIRGLCDAIAIAIEAVRNSEEAQLAMAKLKVDEIRARKSLSQA